jgi:ABC-type antimicrobial peptide transport system permease subunit
MYLQPGGGGDGLEIVGVIEDLRYRDLITSLMADGNSPDVFFAFNQVPSGTVEVATRVQGDPVSFIAPLRELAAAVDPDLPVYQVQPLVIAYEAQTATARFAAFLMGLLSALAIVLACVGIYGVLAFAVGQRAQEIAIRRAIGASVGDVARSVVGDGLRLTAIGLVVGGVGAAASSRILESFLFEISPADPVTFLSVGGSMIAVAVLAAVIPSLRAMRRDPADALNAE